MNKIARQVINFYLKNLREPTPDELIIEDVSFLEKKGSIFITVYRDGEITGSSGNIKEIEKSIFHEIIKNSIEAISNDKRFKKITDRDSSKLKIRVDYIKDRTILQKGKLKELEPVKSGIIVIDKQYDELAIILPNISPLLLTGADFYPAIDSKLTKNFNEDNFIVYAINTDIYRD